jgi:hypothetical protein
LLVAFSLLASAATAHAEGVVGGDHHATVDGHADREHKWMGSGRKRVSAARSSAAGRRRLRRNFDASWERGSRCIVSA